MKLLKRILKITLGLVLITVVLVVGAAFTVWTWPGLVVNQRNLPYLTKYLRKMGIELEYKSADLSAESLAFWRKKVRLKAADLCVRMPSSGVNVCFPAVDVTAVVELPKFRLELGPASLTGGIVDYREVATKPAADSEDEGSGPPEFPRWLSLRDVRIDVAKFSYLSALDTRGKAPPKPQLRAQGKFTLTAEGGERDGVDWMLQLVGDASQGTDKYGAKGLVHLRSLGSPLAGPFSIESSLQLQLPGERKHVSVALTGRPRGGETLELKLRGELQERGNQYKLAFEGEADPKHVKGVISGSAPAIGANVKRLGFRQCRFDWKLPEVGQKRGLSLKCPIDVVADIPPLKNTPLAKFVERIPVNLDAELTTMGIPWNKKGSAEGTVRVYVEPLIANQVPGKLDVSAGLKGSFADFPNLLEVDTSMTLLIPLFEKVVSFLEPTSWAIPSPLNNLSGMVEVTAKGAGAFRDPSLEIPIQMRTRLASATQQFDVDGNGKLRLSDPSKNLTTHLDLKIALSAIELELPTMGIQGAPRLFPDPRIRATKPTVVTQKNAKKSFTYNVEIASTADHPIILKSNVAKGKVPVVLQVHASDSSGVTGSIRLLPFPVELFHRTATIQRMDLKIARDPQQSEINGEIKVVYTDYTIRILLLGLLSEPTIKFMSDPPLPENQVMAVLLFGKKMDALDQNQAQSVGSARAAMADSAVSLASMYLLASTPIESIGYNPITKTVTAKVRLADGTSLNIGTDMRELNQIGIRKRLGSRWTISTYLDKPFDPIERSLNAFLEWTLGY